MGASLSCCMWCVWRGVSGSQSLLLHVVCVEGREWEPVSPAACGACGGV